MRMRQYLTVVLHKKHRELQEVTATTKINLPNLWNLITPNMAKVLYYRKPKTVSFITDYIQKDEQLDFDVLMRIDSLSYSTDA